MESSELVEKEGMCSKKSHNGMTLRFFLVCLWVSFFHSPFSIFLPCCLIKVVCFWPLVLVSLPSNSEKTLRVLSLDLAKVSQYKRRLTTYRRCLASGLLIDCEGLGMSVILDSQLSSYISVLSPHL